MTDARKDTPDLQRQALEALRRMRERVEQEHAARTEPLAIVGLGCRLPGAPDAQAFWELLRSGGDAIRDIPPERFDLARFLGSSSAPNKAGLLDRVDGFDAEFFGIPGREARLMDPQQRLFLEVVWEALESAGIAPTSLMESRTGVFVGSTTTDYLHELFRRLPAPELDAYIVSGTMPNAIAGRVAYTLGLHGPALAIDSACSSSLVAVDRACRSVRDGESRLAIAGGVNLVLAPHFLACLARWGMLASDGRCKSFDASADGFVRAEGCGVILIKRLSHARADGDRILALIRGSAVNQDGPSSGFSVPNALAQAQVLREALAAAGVSPASVGYVEAHGTGTALGDPIEMDAIATVYGAQRSRPLVVGAVKSNVGHLEAAAGITGIIKTVLALQHRQVPPNVNFRVPTPNIPWSEIAVRVPTALEPWEAIDGRRIAGVSSFGFSGTNAHLILEQAPQEVAAEPIGARAPHLLTLSARSAAALDALAGRYADRLEAGADPALASLAAAAGRAHMPHRLSVVGSDATAIAASLRAAARGEELAGLKRGVAVPNAKGRIAFLFTGQGAQYAGMGRGLAEASPVFREALERCAALIDPLLERPLLEVMFAPAESKPPLDQTGYAQPAIFSIQYALAAHWKSVGVTPSLVLGHSVGEFAAACCAGVMTLEDAARLVAMRGRLMQELPVGGAMAAVFAPERAVAAAIAQVAGVVVIAGINGPDETVISGEAAAVKAVIDGFAAKGVRAEAMKVSHAFHSPLMQPMLARFEQAASSIARAQPQVRVVSSMTGRMADADWASASYWVEQLRSPVRYAEAIHTAAGAAIATALEIGPHPVLAALGRRSLPDADIAWLASLRRGHGEAATLAATLGELYVRGVVDDWSGRDGQAARSRVELPTYPFQRSRYWVDEPKAGAASAPRPGSWAHPLLGWPLALASGDAIFETAAGDPAHAFLREHRFDGLALWPATASAEMLLAAGRELGGSTTHFELRDLELRSPLVIPDEGSVKVQTVVRPSGDGSSSAEILREPAAANERWASIAAARIVPAPSAAAGAAAPLEALRARCPQDVDPQLFYAALAGRGAQFGPAFRSLEAIATGKDEAIGRVRIEAASKEFLFHPVLLDGCLQLAAAAAGETGPTTEPLYLPVHLARIARHGEPGTTVWCHAAIRREAHAPRTLWADISVWNLDGTPVATIEGARFDRMSAASLGRASAGLLDSAGYEMRWHRHALVAKAPRSRWLVVGSDSGLGEAIVAELRAREVKVATTLERAAQVLDGAPDEIVHLGDLPSALALVQACAGSASRARLWLVTREGQAVRAGEAPSPEAAALWGFGRVVRAEHPEMACSLLDVDAAASAKDIVSAISACDASESHLALRGARAHVARIARIRRSQEFRLSVPRPGSIDDVVLAPFTPRDPGPGEIRIEVHAAGLNFRDVLCALGMYPGVVEALGGECAGVVSAVGPGVTSHAIRDDVIALAPGGLGTSVVVPDHFAARRPAGLPVEQASALPVAYLTASYALEHLAKLAPGERVLVHSAAGGVGMAAVRIAKLLGAEVFATASEAKRDLVRSAGVKHVFDSRSLGFRDEILAATGGKGVDVVLNALAGEFIPASLALLGSGGRFLEMGKRDIYTPAQIERSHPGVVYRAFDLGQDALRDPTLAPRLFAALLGRLARGELEPLPVTVFALEDPHPAFQAMAQGRHTGKLVARRNTPRRRRITLEGEGTYLLTGGFGAVGLAVASELVARGARHLTLMGRRAPNAQAREAIRALEGQGATIREVLCDIGGADATAQLRAIAAGAPRLRGVIHAAGVLSDAMIVNQNPARFEAVLGPKLAGAKHLVEATEGVPLDFFVLFSAAASWVGNPGQSNYAAANATLDAIAHALASRGRPALSIAWGRWAGGGMAADGSRDWAAMGLGEITPRAGVDAMLELARSAQPAASVLPLDWNRYLARVYGSRVPQLFAEVVEAPQAAASQGSALVAEFLATPANQRRALLVSRLEALLRKVVGIPPERRIDAALPVRDLGMDSLMTVELRNAIARAVDHALAATLVFDHPTLDALATHLMNVVPALKAPQAAPEEARVDAAAAELHAMSDAEAEAELLRELQQETHP